MMWRVQENETSEEKWKSEQASEESDVAKLNWWEINDVESRSFSKQMHQGVKWLINFRQESQSRMGATAQHSTAIKITKHLVLLDIRSKL
jgi:hypothetical protein